MKMEYNPTNKEQHVWSKLKRRIKKATREGASISPKPEHFNKIADYLREDTSGYLTKQCLDLLTTKWKYSRRHRSHTKWTMTRAFVVNQLFNIVPDLFEKCETWFQNYPEMDRASKMNEFNQSVLELTAHIEHLSSNIQMMKINSPTAAALANTNHKPTVMHDPTDKPIMYLSANVDLNVPHQRDEDEMYPNNDESLETSTASSGDFDYETLYFQILSDIKILNEENATKEHEKKVGLSEIKTEFEIAKKRDSELQNENNKLVAETNQLIADKKKRRFDHSVSLANAVEDYKMARSQIDQLTTRHSELENAITIETSWKESLKAQLEANEIINADAQSKLNTQIQKQGEKIETLERQLETKKSDAAARKDQLVEKV